LSLIVLNIDLGTVFYQPSRYIDAFDREDRRFTILVYDINIAPFANKVF
jgi:hypothetical protein